jgi:hypothetical protein
MTIDAHTPRPTRLLRPSDQVRLLMSAPMATVDVGV